MNLIAWLTAVCSCAGCKRLRRSSDRMDRVAEFDSRRRLEAAIVARRFARQHCHQSPRLSRRSTRSSLVFNSNQHVQDLASIPTAERCFA